MAQQADLRHSSTDPRALLVCLLGVLVAVVPVIYLPFPGDGGPITFAVRFSQVLLAASGVGVVYIGYRSYKTANLKPAITVAMTIASLVLVFLAGGLVELQTGHFVPIWLWAISVLAALVGPLTVMYGVKD